MTQYKLVESYRRFETLLRGSQIPQPECVWNYSVAMWTELWCHNS